MPAHTYSFIIGFFSVSIALGSLLILLQRKRVRKNTALFLSLAEKLNPVKFTNIRFVRTVSWGWKKREYHFDYGDFYFFDNYVAVLGKRPGFFTTQHLAPVLLTNGVNPNLSGLGTIECYSVQFIAPNNHTNAQMELVYQHPTLKDVKTKYFFTGISPELATQFQRIFVL